jgi:pimeloyl-ACP methyl ester carboxylesterase
MAVGQQDPIRIEGQAFAELAALHTSPVFWGRNVPRGDGRLVVVVPGLFGNDLYLRPLRDWLRRMGYRPARSSLTINAGCPERLLNTIEHGVQRQLEASTGPVALIGHSRGGMLCWAFASRLGSRVSHLALVGSPAPAVVEMFRREQGFSPAGVAHSAVASAGQRAMKLFDPDCTVPECGCPYVQDIRRPLSPSTKVLSISSRDDPIVAAGATEVRGGENVTVSGSHGGLAHNRAVFEHLGRFLATR